MTVNCGSCSSGGCNSYGSCFETTSAVMRCYFKATNDVFGVFERGLPLLAGFSITGS